MRLEAKKAEPNGKNLDEQRKEQAEDYFKRAMESSERLREFVRNRERGLFQVLNPDSARGLRLGRRQVR